MSKYWQVGSYPAWSPSLPVLISFCSQCQYCSSCSQCLWSNHKS